MLSSDFLAEFKRATEAKWSKELIDQTLYGFQFQRGTRWNAGLSDEQVTEYEGVLRVRFPHDFRTFLREMNGTDLAMRNVSGTCGEPQSDGLLAYIDVSYSPARKGGSECVSLGGASSYGQRGGR